MNRKKNYITHSFKDMFHLKLEREKYRLYNNVLVNYIPQ